MATILAELALADIARQCAAETERFFQRRPHDPRYCYALFQRAIVERHEQAWQLLYRQYYAQVIRWVRRHSAFPTTGENADYFCNRALEKFWSALSPERFADFPTLPALLRYLQLCVHSVVIDHVRRRAEAILQASVDLDQLPEIADTAQPGNLGLDRVIREELWQEVSARLNNEQERQVLFGAFILNLKPRQICVHYPEQFQNVTEVYRAKEKVLGRLRRDEALQQLLREYVEGDGGI